MFWVISHGIKESGMPAFDDLTETARWQITSYVKTLSAALSTAARGGEKPVTIRLRATVAGKPLNCASSYEGLGVNHVARTDPSFLNDPRFSNPWPKDAASDTARRE